MLQYIYSMYIHEQSELKVEVQSFPIGKLTYRRDYYNVQYIYIRTRTHTHRI